MTTPLLTVRGVKTFYGRVMALKGVDVEVREGEIVALIGANGAGKSTLMMTICGNPRAREGQIIFDGQDITELPTHLRADDGAGKSADGRHRRPARAFRRRPRACAGVVSAAARAPRPARRHT